LIRRVTVLPDGELAVVEPEVPWEALEFEDAPPQPAVITATVNRKSM
jgi:hypothetical protein